MHGALAYAKGLGFSPGAVLDVGAGWGTPALYETFPDARHIFIEPLEENTAYLARIVRNLRCAEHIRAVATDHPGFATIHVHPDLLGSSLCHETSGSSADGVERRVPATTLDEIARERNLSGPFLVKLDVQGGELLVLQGAANVLLQTEYIVMEVSLFQFFDGGPQILEVMDFMSQHNYVVYDVLGLLERPLDGALAQLDLAFVREGGMFRAQHAYASEAQRAEQTRSLLARRDAESKRGNNRSGN